LASDLLLGWLIGIMTVIGPQVALYIVKLRKQISFLSHPEETLAEKVP
jgi:hypothetical protein